MKATQVLVVFCALVVLAVFELIVGTLFYFNLPQTGAVNISPAPLIVIGYVGFGLLGMIVILIVARIAYNRLGEEE